MQHPHSHYKEVNSRFTPSQPVRLHQGDHTIVLAKIINTCIYNLWYYWHSHNDFCLCSTAAPLLKCPSVHIRQLKCAPKVVFFWFPVRPLDLDPTQLPGGKKREETNRERKEKKKKSRDSSMVRAPDSWLKRSRVRIPAGTAGEFSSPGSTFCADSYFGIRSTPVLPQ